MVSDPGAVRRVQLLPGFTVLVLTVLLFWLAITVANVLLFFFLAVLVAVYLDALAAFIAKRTKVGPGASFALAMLVTLAALAGIGALLVPPVVEQTHQLVAKLPDYTAAWKDRLAHLGEEFPGDPGARHAGQSSTDRFRGTRSGSGVRRRVAAEGLQYCARVY